jgi:hypothetical protein
MLSSMNVDVRPIGRSTDPNGASRLPLPVRDFVFFFAESPFFFFFFFFFFLEIASIFKRMSDVPDLDYNTSQDFTAAYKVSPGTNSTHPFFFFLSLSWSLSVVVFVSCFAEIHRLQKDADDRREARTHARDRPALHPRAYRFS